jgi:hypothetical protein
MFTALLTTQLSKIKDLIYKFILGDIFDRTNNINIFLYPVPSSLDLD